MVLEEMHAQADDEEGGGDNAAQAEEGEAQVAATPEDLLDID